MRDYLDDSEKRMLFCSLSRELKFLENSSEDYSELIKVIYRLQNKFEYDKVFHQAYNDGYRDCRRLESNLNEEDDGK